LFELKVSELIKLPDTKFQMPVKYQSVRRDISVVVDKNISVGNIVNTVNEAKFDNLIEFYAFDVYEGSGIEDNKKSIAFLILMQDTYKTLEDKEVNNTVNQVLSLLKDKFNAQLR
jgi:phenylalanyl-tRNA synthetase beta chain